MECQCWDEFSAESESDPGVILERPETLWFEQLNAKASIGADSDVLERYRVASEDHFAVDESVVVAAQAGWWGHRCRQRRLKEVKFMKMLGFQRHAGFKRLPPISRLVAESPDRILAGSGGLTVRCRGLRGTCCVRNHGGVS